MVRKMITYSTNWMGPINRKWIEENGNGWAAGRIDIFGDIITNGEYLEIGLPMMDKHDWNNFTRWLEGDYDSKGFETETVWTLDQLVEEYEKTNPKITWWKK